MGWGRLDDEFYDWPEILALLDHDDQGQAREAIGLWTLCFSWANRNTRKKGRKPGLLPAGLPRKFYGADGRACAELLVRYELWEPMPDGGWRIVHFEESLPSDETRAARAEAGRRGAAKRWGKQAASKPSNAAGKLPSGGGNLPAASHPPDSNDEANDSSRTRGPTPIPIPPPPPTPSAAVGGVAALEPTREEGEGGDQPNGPDEATALVLGVPWPADRTPNGATRPRLVRLVRACLDRGHAPEVVRKTMTQDLNGVRSPVGVVVRRLEDLTDTDAELAAADLADPAGETTGGRPPWCGVCDENTRMRTTDDERALRCPDCHPTTRSRKGAL